MLKLEQSWMNWGSPGQTRTVSYPCITMGWGKKKGQNICPLFPSLL